MHETSIIIMSMYIVYIVTYPMMVTVQCKEMDNYRKNISMNIHLFTFVLSFVVADA